jgi:hypothetical protein
MLEWYQQTVCFDSGNNDMMIVIASSVVSSVALYIIVFSIVSIVFVSASALFYQYCQHRHFEYYMYRPQPLVGVVIKMMMNLRWARLIFVGLQSCPP